MSEYSYFWWFLFFVIILGIVWYAQSGSTLGEPLREPPASPGYSYFQEETPGPAPVQAPQQKAPETAPRETMRPPGISEYQGKISLYPSAVSETDPQAEYMEIFSSESNKETITITGWTLTNANNFNVPIGKGASFVFSAQVNPQAPITLKPGDKAIIVTGRSPIGTNFQINKCSGYFNQFQRFAPHLTSQCPRPENEPGSERLPNECKDYLAELNNCRTPIQIPDQVITAGCSSYVEENISYNGCVKNHKDDKDFYKNEWRIYLGRDQELWQNRRETITLRDSDGKLVAQISY